MSHDNDRHIVPNDEDGWDIRKTPESERAGGHFHTQADAIERAKEIIHNAGGGTLHVHAKDGHDRQTINVD